MYEKAELNTHPLFCFLSSAARKPSHLAERPIPMKLSLMGFLFSVTPLAAAAIDVPTQAATPSIVVAFGKPTYMHRLQYLKMYAEKPFEEAVLYYYDNGLYKIISPGENHYGAYVVEGAFTDNEYRISYISFPSVDWGGNVARHDLVFNKNTQTFEQKALAQVDQNIPLQHGRFNQEKNLIENPVAQTWDAYLQR